MVEGAGKLNAKWSGNMGEEQTGKGHGARLDPVTPNPLMRFDGYYLLSDLLGLPNLQDRAFRFGRWHLRETLFGLGDPPPEGASPYRRRILLGYAYATWIYRALLFLGIALLVYHLFFKVLGIFLMAVEIIWFLALPIYREVGEWRRRGAEMAWNRSTRRSALVGGLLLLALILPWRGTLTLPAVHRASAFQAIFPPSPALLIESLVTAGKRVDQNEPLFRLIDPEIDRELERQRREARLAALELSRQAGDPERLEQRLVLEERLEKARCEIRRQQKRQEQLVIKAPFAGRIQTTAEGLTPGRWVGTREELAYLVAPGKSEVIAYLGEEDIETAKPGDRGRFYAVDPALGPVEVVLKEIDPAPVQQFGHNDLYVASTHGGEVAAKRSPEGQVVPEKAIYRLRLELKDTPLTIDQAVRGSLALNVSAGSGVLQRGLQRAWALLIRESGF
ncbi:MAG: HlyD family efflux transporter periplasmic adaptor subunit [Gammaproteobacteria bacterium]|nr:HlyD family efflux transporter periplasmic adaptor subunit [Gammaproteobacteria bacterium]MBU1655427.1 HlyD family efflux transporter periplasmic adaptor subunit [Gammaproteobacteria bacterium]MBU1961060.1 HlyD family efflux transporter periplasmic adaptor subunit [Gammaproteobacteria bacterium]